MGVGLFCLNRVLKKYQLLISFQIKIVTCVFEYLFDSDAGRGSDLQNTKFHVQVFTETHARTCLCLCSNVYIHVVMYQVSESVWHCRRLCDLYLLHVVHALPVLSTDRPRKIMEVRARISLGPTAVFLFVCVLVT